MGSVDGNAVPGMLFKGGNSSWGGDSGRVMVGGVIVVYWRGGSCRDGGTGVGVGDSGCGYSSWQWRWKGVVVLSWR